MATEQKQKTSGLKDQLTTLLHEALMPMKELLGEKKYTNRIKKAVKLITEGIEKKNKDTKPKDGEKKEAKVAAAAKKEVETPAVKKAEIKKAASPAKKAAPKKTEIKKATQPKAAPAKKAVTAKKAPVKSK